MTEIRNTELTLETIHEGLSSITFAPPLKIDAYLCKDDNELNYVAVNFDFGLSYDFGLYPFFIKDLPLDDWIGRTKRIVEFELFHSFVSGCNMDPNYSTLNWALFGNLAHRVTCGEGVGFEDREVWTYDRNFKAIFEPNHYNLKFT